MRLFASLIVRLRNVARSLALWVIRAGEELAIPPELFGHWGAAVFALLVCDNLLPFHVAQMVLGGFDVFREFLVELREGYCPTHLAFFYLVKLLFHVRRVLDVEE